MTTGLYAFLVQVDNKDRGLHTISVVFAENYKQAARLFLGNESNALYSRPDAKIRVTELATVTQQEKMFEEPGVLNIVRFYGKRRKGRPLANIVTKL